MSLVDKRTHTFEQTFKSLRSVQDAGFRAATALAERTPGLPGAIATTVTAGTGFWVKSYSLLAERALEGRLHTAEQLASLNEALVSPRRPVEEQASA